MNASPGCVRHCVSASPPFCTMAFSKMRLCEMRYRDTHTHLCCSQCASGCSPDWSPRKQGTAREGAISRPASFSPLKPWESHRLVVRRETLCWCMRSSSGGHPASRHAVLVYLLPGYPPPSSAARHPTGRDGKIAEGGLCRHVCSRRPTASMARARFLSLLLVSRGPRRKTGSRRGASRHLSIASRSLVSGLFGHHLRGTRPDLAGWGEGVGCKLSVAMASVHGSAWEQVSPAPEL